VGVAAPLAEVHRDAQGLVAVALHVLDLALAHRDRQAGPFGDLDTGVGGAQRLREGQGVFHQLLEIGPSGGIYD